jgi:hypothetical protein
MKVNFGEQGPAKLQCDLRTMKFERSPDLRDEKRIRLPLVKLEFKEGTDFQTIYRFLSSS